MNLRPLMRLVLSLIVLAAIALSPRNTPVRAASAMLGANLIVNGNAEFGPVTTSTTSQQPIPGWLTTGHLSIIKYGTPGGFPTATDPGPTTRYNNFFGGGPNDPQSVGTQGIDVTNLGPEIDTGGLIYTLSGYLGGYASQEDSAKLAAHFYDVMGNLLGTTSIGPVTASDRGNATGLLFRQVTADVPIGTCRIDITLTMVRAEGANNDGYADNLSLVLTNPSAQATPTATDCSSATPPGPVTPGPATPGPAAATATPTHTPA